MTCFKMEVRRQNTVGKYIWKIIIIIGFTWIFKLYIWRSNFSEDIIISADDVIGKVISRHPDGWHVDNDICNQKTDDFVLTYMKKPPNTPIYVYPEMVDNYISNDLIHLGGYEIYNVDTLLEYMKRFPEAVFLDLGAFVGSYSITMASLGYKVVAVECLPSSVARLCASMIEARIKDKIIIVNNALSDRRERVRLKTEPGNVGVTYVDNAPGSNYSVDSIFLNDLLEIFPFKQVIMKMDVHFQEDYVLRGADLFFQLVRVEVLLIEFVHHQADQYGQDGKFIVDFLDSHGMEPDVPVDMKKDYKKWPTSEILFKRKHMD